MAGRVETAHLHARAPYGQLGLVISREQGRHYDAALEVAVLPT